MAKFIILFFILTSCSTKKLNNANSASLFDEISENKSSCTTLNSKDKINSFLKEILSKKEMFIQWNNIGNCYSQIQNYKKAFYYYDLALSDKTSNPKQRAIILSNLSNIYSEIQNYELSQSTLKQAFSLDPSNNTILYKNGLINLIIGDYKSAQLFFEKINQVYPKDNDVLLNLGITYLLQNKYQELNSKVLPFIDDKNYSKKLFKLSLLKELTKKQKELLKLNVQSKKELFLQKYLAIKLTGN